MKPPAGFALVFSLLLVLALAVLALGLLSVGTREAVIAGAVARKAQAERWAEAGGLEALARWSTRAVADLPPAGERILLDAPGRRVTAIRVDTGLFLLRSEAEVQGPNGPVTARAGLLVRALAASRLAGAFSGALAAEALVTVASGGTVAGDGAGTAACGASAGIVAPTVVVASTDRVTGRPPVDRRRPEPFPRPDPFAPPLIDTTVTVRYTGLRVTPRPSTQAGKCTPDRRNWGSPDSGNPCYGLLPVILASNLVIDGGVARGVVVVDGDLRLEGGAHLEGAVIVRGHLEVAEGSRVDGGVRAAGAPRGG